MYNKKTVKLLLLDGGSFKSKGIDLNSNFIYQILINFHMFIYNNFFYQSYQIISKNKNVRLSSKKLLFE